METDASLSNFSWLTDALQQLFLARKCMAYRCEGAGSGVVHHTGAAHGASVAVPHGLGWLMHRNLGMGGTKRAAALQPTSSTPLCCKGSRYCRVHRNRRL